MINKNYTYKKYKNLFNIEMDSNTVITTQDKSERLIITDTEKWKQCYKPGDKIREQLPKYWFISDKGNLISVAKGKAYLLKKDDSDSTGRYSYHFNVEVDEDTTITKNIECHNLVRIVFGGLSYGVADDLIQEQGVFAFGVKNSEKIKLNGHHIGDKKDNSPGNIELLSTNAHKIIDKVPKKTDTETIHKFLSEFGKMASQEEPKQFSVLLTGQKIDKDTMNIVEDNGYRVLYGTDKIVLSKKAAIDLMNLQNKGLIISVVEVLINTYGLDYFIEPKYLCTIDYSFYKCEKFKEELHITKIDELNELVNKQFIMCYLNKDKQAECLIKVQEEKDNV